MTLEELRQRRNAAWRRHLLAPSPEADRELLAASCALRLAEVDHDRAVAVVAADEERTKLAQRRLS
jgi:hypothetical protein